MELSSLEGRLLKRFWIHSDKRACSFELTDGRASWSAPVIGALSPAATGFDCETWMPWPRQDIAKILSVEVRVDGAQAVPVVYVETDHGGFAFAYYRAVSLEFGTLEKGKIMPQIRLADVVGKTIGHWFVPADGKAVTIIFEEGRMSLGAPIVRVYASADLSGATVQSTALAAVSDTGTRLTFATDKGQLFVEFEGAAALIELPE